MQSWIQLDFEWLLRTSWQASVVALLVLVAQRVFRQHLTPQWRCRLWMLVVLRLLIPAGPESAWSIFNVPGTAGRNAFSPQEAGPDPATNSRGDQRPAGAKVHGSLILIWALVASSLALGVGVQQVRLSRRLNNLPPCTDPDVIGLLRETKDRMGIERCLPVLETDAVSSPALFGFLKPRLLVPPNLLYGFAPHELRGVFLHELSHLKRGDLALGWLLTSLQILHWFNPAIWLAVHRLRTDRELACDQLALSCAHCDENRAYGHTLLRLLEAPPSAYHGPVLVGMLDDGRAIYQRISMIANYKRPSPWSASVAGVLWVTMAAAVLTDPAATNLPAFDGSPAPLPVAADTRRSIPKPPASEAKPPSIPKLAKKGSGGEGVAVVTRNPAPAAPQSARNAKPKATRIPTPATPKDQKQPKRVEVVVVHGPPGIEGLEGWPSSFAVIVQDLRSRNRPAKLGAQSMLNLTPRSGQGARLTPQSKISPAVAAATLGWPWLPTGRTASILDNDGLSFLQGEDPASLIEQLGREHNERIEAIHILLEDPPTPQGNGLNR